jgi:hypothetical protein
VLVAQWLEPRVVIPMIMVRFHANTPGLTTAIQQPLVVLDNATGEDRPTQVEKVLPATVDEVYWHIAQLVEQRTVNA